MVPAKMKTGFLLLTDHSEALNGKLYAMGAGWTVLRLPELPQEWGFGIGLAVDVPWDETNRRHAFALHVEDPDGDVLGDEFSLEFEAGRPPGAPQGQEQRIVLSLQSKQTFATAGPHAVVVRVNGEEIGRERFYVVQVPAEMVTPRG